MADPAPRPPGDPESLTSFELVLRAKAGDETARDILLARYYPRLKRWARGRLPLAARCAHETHDLVQDVILKAWDHLDSFSPRHEGAFQGFVRTILMNRIRDLGRQYNKWGAGAELDDDVGGNDPSPIEEAIGAEMRDRYEAALGRLRHDDRDLIIAKIEMGHSYKDMVSMFDKPSVPAVTMAVSRALVRLAAEMTYERRA